MNSDKPKSIQFTVSDEVKKVWNNLASFYKDHSEAITFLYDPSEEKDRILFFGDLTIKKAEICFSDPLSEDEKKCLDIRPKTREETEKKIDLIYDAFTLPDLIKIYEYHKPQKIAWLPSDLSINAFARTLSGISSGKKPDNLDFVFADNGGLTIWRKPKGEEGDQVCIEVKNKEMLLALHSITSSDNVNGRTLRGYKELRKMFFFILKICNDNGYKSPTFIDTHVMVKKYGMYKTPQTASRALGKYLPLIRDGFDLKYFEYKKPRKKDGKEDPKEAQPFSIKQRMFISSYDYEEGRRLTEINIDPGFNPADFNAFTVIPAWAFALQPNAFAMLHYLFIYARMNPDRIRTDKAGSFGTIAVNIKAICDEIGLPDPKGKNDHPKIRKPFNDAMEKIENRISEVHEKDLKITPKCRDQHPDDAPFKLWYNEGFLEVRFSGSYLSYFSDIQKRREAIKKKFDEKNKKIEDAKLKAIGEAQAKEILKDDENE